MQTFNPKSIFTSILSQNTPAAIARIQGSSDYANLYGTVSFYETPFGGVLVSAEVYGLPGSGFFGMHIHEFGDCSTPSGSMMPGGMRPPFGAQPPFSMRPPFSMQTPNNMPPSGNMQSSSVVQPRNNTQSSDNIQELDNMQMPDTLQTSDTPQTFRNIRPPMNMQPFPNTGNHYNPGNVPHPEHAGDLPPLLSNNGYAWMTFYTGRINVEDVAGRSLVIHSMRDDFTSQPSGDSGDKIGCGVIEEM